MKIEFRLLNCFWLVLPLLAWNILLGSRITDPRINSAAHSPRWLLIAESLTRILVFAFPLLLPLQVTDAWSQAGLGVYFLGTLIYFASWLPLVYASHSAWSNSTLGLLAPRLVPLLSFLGIALIDKFWPYAVLATIFVFLHTWHGIQNL